MKITWDRHLSVGVAEIDHQHKLLIDKFNEFMLASKEGRGSDEVYRLFSFLDAYVTTHFADEERLMQRISYPDYFKHREKHLEFKQTIKTFRERLENEGPTRELINSAGLLMTGWLIGHISGMDSAIGKFMVQREKLR